MIFYPLYHQFFLNVTTMLTTYAHNQKYFSVFLCMNFNLTKLMEKMKITTKSMFIYYLEDGSLGRKLITVLEGFKGDLFEDIFQRVAENYIK